MTATFILLKSVETAAICTSLLVAYVAWQHRQKPAGQALVALTLGGAGWGVTSVVETLISSYDWSILLAFLNHVMGDAVAIGVLYVAAGYAGQRWFYRRPVVGAIGGFVVLNVAVMALNPVHELFYLPGTRLSEEGYLLIEVGPLYWFRIFWDFTFVLVGLGILGIEMVRRTGLYRLQAAGIFVGISLGFGSVIFQIAGLFTVPGFDLSTVGITIATVILLWLLFYADFMEVVPVAHRTLMESMDDAVIALNMEGHVIDTNPHARDLFDVAVDDIGRPVREALDEYPTVVEAITETDSESTEIAVQDGVDERYYDLKLSPIETETGGFLPFGSSTGQQNGRLVVIRDITVQKEKQQQLEQANEQLDQFASFVSHDLRNPLGIAKTYLDFAEDTGDPEDFEAVAEALDRMDIMIEDLLSFARMGGEVSDTEPVEIEAIATDAWANVETEGASLAVDATGTVAGNRESLFNVFENLFRNAREHNDGDVSLRVDVTKTDDDVECIGIEDDGEGIPPDQRSDIFDYGYTTETDGSGFGLAIVETIVDAHGWGITITEGRDGGARFEIETA